MMVRTAALVAAITFGSSPALATLIDNGASTLDTTTGILWLDPTATANLSYEDVVASSWYAEGWRHATLAEVVTLLGTYSIDPPSLPGGLSDCCITPTPVDQLIQALGPTTVDGSELRLRAHFDDGDPGSIGYVLLVEVGGYYAQDVIFNAWDPADPWVDNGVDQNVGHLLVLVPEPSTAPLVGLGTALLTLARRTRSRVR
jgi:hypothetical protein